MSTENVVIFKFFRGHGTSITQKVFEYPDPALINLTIGTVLEINFEKDAYYADFKIHSKSVSQITNNEGVDITYYEYMLKYVSRSTRTKTEYETQLKS